MADRILLQKDTNYGGIKASTTMVMTSTSTLASTASYFSFLERLFYSMTVDFQSSGLPWSGQQCKSLRAGGSSILCVIPMLVEVSPIAKCWWILQGFLALQADYFHVHHPSAWHGMDKIAAVMTFVGMSYRVYIGLDWKIYIPLVIIPSFFFWRASRAKDNLDLEGWKWCHLGWHVFGPCNSAIAIYLFTRLQ